MANKLYDDTSIKAIANAIRAKNGKTDTYTVSEMAGAINDIPAVGGVESVNGKTGAVVLTAEDVGAISQDDLQAATNEALAQAKASGEFDEQGNPVYYPKTQGTATSTSFCIVTIDRRNRKIHAVSYGAGHDRTFDY